MTTTPTIIMKFRENEPTSIEVQGVKGAACRAFSAPFEALLGGKLLSSTPTHEAFQPAVANTTSQVKTC